MRKWMRDRLKRPKKHTEAGTSEPAQAPLQPAYYDTADAPAPATPRKLAEPEAAEPEIEARSAPDPQPDRDEAAEARTIQPRSPRPEGNSDPRRRRRRGKPPPRFSPGDPNTRRCGGEPGSAAAGLEGHRGSRHRVAGIREELLV